MDAQQTINQINGIDMDALLNTVSAIQNDPQLAQCTFRATNKWVDATHNCTTIENFYGAKQENWHPHKFDLHADEPVLLAGQDSSPNPAEHLLHALAGCITTGLVAHAAVRGIHIEELESEIEGDIDLRGFLGLDPHVPKGYTNIRIKIRVKSDVDDIEKLRKLPGFSPILVTVTEGAHVDLEIEPK